MVEKRKATTGQKILDFLTYFNPKIFSVILILAMFIPMIRPFLIPISVNPYSVQFVEFIKKHSGGICFYHAESAMFGVTSGLHAEARAVLEALFKYRVKVIVVPVGIASSVLTPDFHIWLVKNYGLDGKYGYEYGRDWVVMPWQGTLETALAAATVFENMRTDYYGTPIENLPIFRGLKNLGDVDFVVAEYEHCATIDQAIRQYYAKYGKQILAVQINCWGPTVAYAGKGVAALIEGTQGAAEIEYLIGEPALGMSYMAPTSMLSLLFFIFLVLSNIIFWSRRILALRKQKERGVMRG